MNHYGIDHVTEQMVQAANARCAQCIRTAENCSPEDCNRRRYGAMLAASPAKEYSPA